MVDFRKADLDQAQRGMLEFAVKLTNSPQSMNGGDIDSLRRLGFDDPAIHDIVQVTAMFNYYNRLADGLGIESEVDW